MMPPSIYNTIEGGGDAINYPFIVASDRFPYAGITRFRFTGYDLSPAIAGRTPPTF